MLEALAESVETMRNRMSALALAIALAAGHAYASPECPDDSGCHAQEIAGKNRDAALGALSGAERKLTNLLAAHADVLDNRLTDAVKAQAISWRSFVADNCEIVGASSPGASPWQSAEAVDCERSEFLGRIKKVNSVIDCLRLLKEDDWITQAPACVSELAT